MPQPRRTWRNFAETREYVRAQRFENQKAYEVWSQSGQRPGDIPGSPPKAYVNEWEGWADFLGNNGSRPRRVCASRQYLLFVEAREFVRKLGLQTQKEYAAWAKTTDRPVGIPAGPYSIYGDQWTNWSDWLGARGADGYRPFEEARAYVHAQHFSTRQEWLDHTASPDFPKDLPIYPEYGYRDSGWVDWPDWLGVAGKLTRPRILAILNAITEVIPDLRPAELYAILCHKGVMTTDRRHTHIEALRALEELCNSGNVEETLTKALTSLDSSRTGNTSPLVEGDAADISGPERELTSEEIERACPVPKLRSLESLRVVDKAASLGLVGDSELIDFLFSSRLAALWQEVFDGNPEFSPEKLQAAETGQYFDVIRDRFLTEYHGALNLQLPEGYAFHKNGQFTPPNLMQRLTAFRLKTQKRLINASGVGAGKSLSAAFSAQVVGAKLTIIVAVNATLENLDETIKTAFPQAVRILKERGPYIIDPRRPTFVILNFESFQQDSWSEEMVSSLLSHRIDMIVVDEIQSVRLRSGNEESNRRRRLRSLIEEATVGNPDLFVLGMSATPVMNDLHEAKTLLELVTGQDLSHLPTRPTVMNAILYYQILTRYGLRHRPNYPQTIETVSPVIDGSSVLAQLQMVKPRDLLGMEQALLRAKLPTIRELAKPGTLIYTPFVTGIIDPLVDAIASLGLRAGIFTGEEKRGYSQFLAREVDVLIGSEPIGTGVDKLQEVGNRLIFVSLPWTSAQYDQVVGRLHRQGMRFDKVEVFIPQVELRHGDHVWSWDKTRFDRIQFKRTLADAAVDGVIPEGKLPSREEMQEHSLRALRKWINQVEGPAAIEMQT